MGKETVIRNIDEVLSTGFILGWAGIGAVTRGRFRSLAFREMIPWHLSVLGERAGIINPIVRGTLRLLPEEYRSSSMAAYAQGLRLGGRPNG